MNLLAIFGLLALLALCQASHIYRVKTLPAPKSSESNERGGKSKGHHHNGHSKYETANEDAEDKAGKIHFG